MIKPKGISLESAAQNGPVWKAAKGLEIRIKRTLQEDPEGFNLGGISSPAEKNVETNQHQSCRPHKVGGHIDDAGQNDHIVLP